MSYTTNFVNGNIRIENGKIRLPKVGWVKVVCHREVPEGYKLKSVTVSRDASGEYYVSLLFEFGNEIKKNSLSHEGETCACQAVLHRELKALGLDYSMHELYKDSNGEEPEYPRYYRKAERKLAREQRRLSKMQKGSKNRAKQRLRVAKLHKKVTDQRKDFLHKRSRQIANAYDIVCIEDLNMKAMSQCLHFGKSVSDNGWGMFTFFLAYKLEESGKQLVKVDRFFASSQICHVCGTKNPVTKDLGVRAWVCPVCGAHHDRDENAAINIREEGLRMLTA